MTFWYALIPGKDLPDRRAARFATLEIRRCIAPLIIEGCRRHGPAYILRSTPVISSNCVYSKPHHFMTASTLRLLPRSFQLLANTFVNPTTRTFASSTINPATMTAATFNYMEPGSFDRNSTEPFVKPWGKVDVSAWSFKMGPRKRSVQNLRGQESEFTTDNAGFAVYYYTSKEKSFTDEKAVREGYYAEVEKGLRDKLPGIKKVVIFDHTIRRRVKDAPRQPVQQVHVDQTPGAAEVRVRRHVAKEEAEELLKGRYQIINVWRPIENPATDFPLAVIDWRSTEPEDFVKVDLLYPKRDRSQDDDDRGKEVLADPSSLQSTEGYEVKGETYGVAPRDSHKFYYLKDMTPDEMMFIKCFDSRGQGLEKGRRGLARGSPHTAFSE